MNKHVIPVLLVVMTNVALAQTEESDKVLAKGRVGKVLIGMTADNVYDLFPDSVLSLFNQNLEGTYSPAILVKNEGIVVELECDKVFRIRVGEGAYKTEKGFMVGMTLGELRSIYDQLTLLQGEGNYVVSLLPLRISFVIDLDSLDREKVRNNSYQEFSDFPDSALIGLIMLF